jgi:hypothetical protein
MRPRLPLLSISWVIACALLCSLADGSLALEGGEGEAGAVWTAIIPEAFPNDIYTWHMKDDRSYREDGRDAASGRPIQRRLSGRWSREGARMILRQDDQPFVFDGAVLGNLYSGTLYYRGNPRSRFCAARGEVPPDHCAPPNVAMRQMLNAP